MPAPMSFAEIADREQLDEAHVRKIFQRAMEKLQKHTPHFLLIDMKAEAARMSDRRDFSPYAGGMEGHYAEN